MITRRIFSLGVLAAPAIVRPGLLMPVKMAHLGSMRDPLDYIPAQWPPHLVNADGFIDYKSANEWINQEINKELTKLIHQHDGKRSYVDAGGHIVFADKGRRSA
jgi:hypothetical protein